MVQTNQFVAPSLGHIPKATDPPGYLLNCLCRLLCSPAKAKGPPKKKREVCIWTDYPSTFRMPSNLNISIFFFQALHLRGIHGSFQNTFPKIHPTLNSHLLCFLGFFEYESGPPRLLAVMAESYHNPQPGHFKSFWTGSHQIQNQR